MPTSRFRKLFASLFVFVALCAGAQAAEYYWIGGGADNNWTTVANWSTTEGATPGTGTACPGAGDDAYIYGTVTITIDSDISIRKLLIKSGTNNLTSNFTTTLSGTGSLTVTDNSDAAINITRCASDNPASIIGTLVINLPLTCSGSIQTHSGTTLSVAADKTLSAANLVHSAGNGVPVSKIQVNGTLDLGTGTLNLSGNGNPGANQLVVESGGSVKAGTIEFGQTTYQNTGISNPIINNGTIEVSSSFTIPNFTSGVDLPYDGEGTIILNGNNASFINNDNVEISIKTLQGGTQTSVVSGGGHTTIESATFNGDITLSGANTFKNFTAAALGDHTLTVNAVQTIQDDGSVSLSGTDNSSRLTVTGNGTGNFALGSVMLNGNYLSLDTASNVVSSLDGTAFAQNTVTTGSGSSNWVVTAAAEHVWKGGADGAWDDESNWLPPSVPGAADDVIINAGSPTITTAAYVRDITISGSSSINIASGSLTLNPTTTYELDNKISGNGTLILASGKTFSVNSANTFNVNIENNGTLNASGAVTFNKDYTNKGTATFDVASSITGNFVNASSSSATFTGGLSLGGTFTDSGTTFSGAVTLNNSTEAQSFSGKSETSTYSVAINKTSGNVTFPNALTLSSLTTNAGYEGEIIFSGEGNQSFTAQSDQYKKITVIKDSGASLNVSGDLQTEAFVQTTGDVQFNDDFQTDSYVQSAGNVQFNGNVQAGTYTHTAGSIDFKGDATFTNDVSFNNSSPNTVTFTGGTSVAPHTISGHSLSLTNLTGDYLTVEATSDVSINGANIKGLSILSTTPSVKMQGTITATGTEDFVIDYPLLLSANTSFDIAGNIIIKDSASKVGSINSENTTARTLALTAGTGKSIQIQNGTSDGAGLGTTNSLSTITINSSLDLSADTVFETSDTNGTTFADTTNSLTGSSKLTLTGNMRNTGSWTYGSQLAVTGNLTNSGTAVFNKQLAVTGNLTNNNSASATFNDDVSVTGNVTDNGIWTSADGKKLIFNGTGDQTFTPKTATTYKLIEVNKSTGSFLTANNKNLNVTNFTLTDCPATTFNGISTFTNFNSNAATVSITFANNTTIKSDTIFNTAGAVNFNNNKAFSFNDGSVKHSVTHTAGPTNISGSISSSSASFGATTITGDTTITTEAGDTINFNGQVTGTASLSTLTTNATATFNANVNIGSLSAQNAKLNCDSITTTGAQIYTGAVTLEKNVELKTTNNTNGNIFFDTTASTINSKAGENHSLSINIPAGRTVTCGGEIGKTNHLSSITIIQSGNTTFNKEVVTNAFEITQADSIEFKGAVTASTFNITKATSTTFDDSVSIGTFTDATTHTGTITFKKGGEITNTSGTIFNTSGAVTFGNAATDTMTFGTASPLAYANLTHTNGATNINGTLNAAEIQLAATAINNGAISAASISAGAVTTSGTTPSITTTGAQSYSGAFQLNGDTALTSTSDGNINFASTIIGSNKLTLTAPSTKAITVTGAVGDNTTAPSIKIMQAGSTSFTGNVKLTSFEDDTEHTGAVSFASGGSITNAVTFNTTGDVSITGPMTIGAASAYKNLTHESGNTNITGNLNAAEIKLGTTSGTTTITSGTISGTKFEAGTLKAAGNITTSDEQHYKGTVELTDTLSLKSSTSSISFDSTITGAQSLSVESNSGSSFGGDVGSPTTKLTSLTVTGPASIGCSNIYTAGVQSFGGAVTLAVDTALTAGGNISFGSTINGNHSITLNCPYNTTNTITVTGAVGSDATSTDDAPSITITQAGNVSFTQTVKAKAFAITKANSTTFSKAVTIKTFTDDVLDKTDNGTITFKNGGSITDAVTFNTTSDITLTGTLETSSIQMNNLVIDGTSKIQTTGTQIYNGTINGKVTSPDSDDILELNSGTGSITFGGNLGQTTKLKKLTVTGPAQINTDLTFTANAISFNTSLTSTTTPASTLTLSNCTSLTNPTAAATVSNIDFIFTGTSGNTTTFTPGNSEYGNITNNTITLKLGNNAFKQNQNASFKINSGSVEKGSGGFNAGKLIVAGGSFTQTGVANDSVYDMKLTGDSLTWDAGAAGGSLEIKGTVTEGAGLHINYNKKNIALSNNNTISGVFWSLTIADGITITNGGSIRIRKDFIINGQYIHNDKTTILGLDMTTNPPADDSTENGEVSNTNATPSNLGKVYINKSTSYSQTAVSNLKFADLEISSGTFTVPVGTIIESNNFINNENCTIANSGTISITKDFTDAGTYTGTGLLNFTGSGAQIFAPGSSTYKNIENTSANPLTVSRDLKAENFTIASGKTSTFAGKTQISNMTISSALETIFTDTVNITNFDDTGHNGKLNFKNSGSIANATEFHTSDSVTIGDNAEDQMIFGTDSAKVDFIHTAGPTNIISKLKAKNITLGDTSTALTKITSGTVNAESLTAGTLEAEGTITTSGLQKYEGSVKLTNDLILKSDNSTITFDSTITGANALSVDSTNGTSFGGDVGNTAEKLTSLTVTGPASIGSSNIFTLGSQSFSGAVTLTTTPSSHTLNAGTISFDSSSTIDGASDLVLVTSAGTSFGAKVGSTTSLSSLDVRGNTTIACSEIKTTGNQNYHSPVILSTSTAITSAAGNLTFDSTIDGNKTLTLSVPDTTLPPAANNSITVSGKVGASTESGITNPPSIIISRAGDVSFGDTVKAENFTITKAIHTNFDGKVLLSTFTDTANAGDISFKNGGTISNGTGTSFITSGTVTFGDNQSDIMNFGNVAPYADLTHTAGNTSITGRLNVANLTLAETAGGPMTISNTGLFTTTDGSALNYATSFSQTGAGNTKLGGSFTGNGNASFATNLQLYGSSQADFGSSGKTINVGGNLIVVREATDELDILSNLSVAENLVLYKGAVTTEADIFAEKDILILGNTYSTTDTSTGITDEYSYTTPRHADWSQPNYTENLLPDGSALPASSAYSATLSVTAGKTISAAENFYANGTNLSTSGSSGQWLLCLPDITKPANGFAEAYHSVVSGCKVTCSDGSTNGSKARLATLECTDSGDGTSTPNTNVEFEDFQITKAYTVRDNAIRVEFNQPVRYHATTINQLNFHDASDSVTTATRFTGFYSDPDCQHELTSDITQSYTDEASGKTYWYFYIKAAPQDSASTGAWNTDASGKNSGAANGKSSDRYGIHHTALACLDFPRALAGSGTTASLSFIITDRWGKRLNNYSRRVPKATAAEAAYGSKNSSDPAFEVADKTGPVMWTVRTGQELHTAYSAATGEASQHSYDSHNFLEFRYSEPVDFTPLNSGETENIRVTNDFGAIKEANINQEADSLTFAGLAQFTAPAGSKLLLHTGYNGTTSKYMNALYRTDEYSIRLSVAGWTDGTVTDYSGNEYKNWTGYIEGAKQFTGAKAKPVMQGTSFANNPLILDLEGNAQIEYAVNKIEPQVYSDSSSENISGLLPLSPDLYSAWDISEPVFTPLRFSVETAWGENEFSEAIGNTNGSGSTLDRIDFHFFDNTPAYNSSDTAEWFTETGWCIPGSEGSKENLYDSSYTYAADIIGGARQFDSVSARRTSGGIRFSTKLNAAQGFKYSTDPFETHPATEFAPGKANVHSTVISQLFTGSSEPQHSANDPDGLYLGLGITDTSLPVETSFAFSYNASAAYLTDLAGNRLRNKTSRTIDRTPPSFDIILSPVDQKQIYIVFVKEIVTKSSAIEFRNSDGSRKNVAEEASTADFFTMLPGCFKLIKINSDGSYAPSTDLHIDTAVPAKLIDRYSDRHFTCVSLTLTKEITYDDLKSLYVQLSHHPDFPETSPDPYTSNSNARVTFIQDQLGNYMQMYSAHALSDFAIGLINPLYAYSSDITENEESVMKGLYEEGSWAVHDFDADQQNYGTLPAAHPAAIVTQQKDGTEDGSQLPQNVRIYLSDSPDQGSVSTQFNKDFKTSLRVWLPDLTDGIFRALSAKNNSHFNFADSTLLNADSPADGLIFDLPLSMINSWKSGDQISFMFGLTESDGAPVKIFNSPYYDNERRKYDFALSTAVPLYSLRMHDTTDIGTLDLWSFRLKGITEQRGGVTILNNVINPLNGENTLIKVNLPEDGRLNVSVLTADGNVITYLNRGTAKQGEHYFTWDGKNRNGAPVARGIYFIRVTGSDIDETRKVMIVKD